MEKYNLYVVYFINCILNENYYDWLQNQLKYTVQQIYSEPPKCLNHSKIYIIPIIKKGKETDFINRLHQYFPKVAFDVKFFYENEYEYQAILKVGI